MCKRGPSPPVPPDRGRPGPEDHSRPRLRVHQEMTRNTHLFQSAPGTALDGSEKEETPRGPAVKTWARKLCHSAPNGAWFGGARRPARCRREAREKHREEVRAEDARPQDVCSQPLCPTGLGSFVRHRKGRARRGEARAAQRHGPGVPDSSPPPHAFPGSHGSAAAVGRWGPVLDPPKLSPASGPRTRRAGGPRGGLREPPSGPGAQDCCGEGSPGGQNADGPPAPRPGSWAQSDLKAPGPQTDRYDGGFLRGRQGPWAATGTRDAPALAAGRTPAVSPVAEAVI